MRNRFGIYVIVMAFGLGACTQSNEIKEPPDVNLEFVPIVAEQGAQLQDPLGRYTLTNNFEIMTTELGLRQFEQIMEYDSRQGNSDTYGEESTVPAYYVNWHMAADVATMVANTGLETCYVCEDDRTDVLCQPG